MWFNMSNRRLSLDEYIKEEKRMTGNTDSSIMEEMDNVTNEESDWTVHTCDLPMETESDV